VYCFGYFGVAMKAWPVRRPVPTGTKTDTARTPNWNARRWMDGLN